LLQSLLGGGTPNIGDTASSLQQFLDAHEDVYAGYVQYQMSKGPFGITGGVRVEHTYDLIHVYSVPLDTNSNPIPIFDANGNATNQPQASLTTATNRYTNAFPSLQARYEITPSLIGRATWSSTLARPGFNQIGESRTVDLGSGNITQGNPALKPATANSFDVSIEQYLEDAGILQLALFDKEIKNYIVGNSSGRVYDPTSNLFLNNISFSNAGSSYARGFELNWQKRFTELPGPLAGLGAGANYTYVDSRFEIRPGEHARLPSTSKETWNASISYDLYGLSVRVAAYSVSSDLFSIGTDKGSDVYNAHRLDMDLGSSYAINPALSVYFNIKRLLNTPHAFYQGTPDRPIQREFYGQDYLFGVRYDFERK
jgi:TonB-dependent receptor